VTVPWRTTLGWTRAAAGGGGKPPIRTLVTPVAVPCLLGRATAAGVGALLTRTLLQSDDGVGGLLNRSLVRAAAAGVGGHGMSRTLDGRDTDVGRCLLNRILVRTGRRRHHTGLPELGLNS
jgi:hypothetical protein